MYYFNKSKALVVLIFAMLSVFVLMLSGGRALALAGMAERSTTHRYSNNAELEYSHPSDLCGYDPGTSKHCIVVKMLKGEYGTTINLPLQSINQPTVDNPTVFAGQRLNNGTWVIFNDKYAKSYSCTSNDGAPCQLQPNTNGLIFEDKDFNKVSAKWKEITNSELKIVKLPDIAKTFPETDSSKSENFKASLMIMSFFIMPILFMLVVTSILILAVFFIVRLVDKYRSHRRRTAHK